MRWKLFQQKINRKKIESKTMKKKKTIKVEKEKMNEK